METQVKYLWPPDWDGELGLPVNKRWIVELLGRETESQSETYTANETNVRKIVLADMAKQDGTAPAKMTIDKITYVTTGFTGIKLDWERDSTNLIAYLPGDNSDNLDYRNVGGMVDTAIGETGDVILTTYGGKEYDSYRIVIDFRLK